jgi:hypothetical protein
MGAKYVKMIKQIQVADHGLPPECLYIGTVTFCYLAGPSYKLPLMFSLF